MNEPAKLGKWRKGKRKYDVLGYFDEAKHVGFTKWLSEADEKGFIKGGITPQLRRGFFTDLLRRGALLFKKVLHFIFMNFFPSSIYVSFEFLSLTEYILQQIDEALYLMRKRSMKFPDIFPQNVITLDMSWFELVSNRYRRATKKRNYLSTWKCPKDLLAYCLGEKPLMNI